ncbi:MAG: SurA N-terminal domain-containing protein [Hyphomonadaceae bacterium]|nr:SurA N-terminal domain-containing protein [Hyphomonadaceae bacterium]
MLTELRKVTRGWVALAIIGLLALAFAIWGINDVFRPVQSNDVANGRGFTISAQEFQLVFDNELKAAEQQSERRFTKQEAVEANFHMQVVDRLVSQRAFDRLAHSVGVNSSDAMVAERIQSNPAFRSQVTGVFDSGTYRSLLAQNGVSRTLYEDDLRQGMTRAQLAQALVAGIRPPSSFGRMILAFESEKRTFTVTAITPNRAPEPPVPTEEDLTAFYATQSGAFALPEYRAFTLIRADPAAFEQSVDVSEDKVRELFEFRKDRLVTPERRSFVVLSGGDEARAQDAARRLAAGEQPDAVGAALGMQVISFAQKTQAEAPDPRIGTAVFAAKAGDVTAPIEGITWSVARVSEVIPGVAPSFEEARGGLRAELARDEAQTLLHDAVEKFEDARAGGADLEAAASQNGLTVVKTPLVDARGLTPEGAPEPTVLDQPDLLKAAFEAAEGDPSDWVSEPDGASYMVRIDTLRPAGAPPLAQVRDRVAAAWRMQKIAAGMSAIADEVAASVRGGARLADVARAKGLPPTATQTVDRRTAQQGPSPQLMAAIFSARAGEVVRGAGGPQGQVLFIASVDAIERADAAADPQGVERGRESVEGAIASDTIATVQAAARAKARVKLNQTLIDSLVGKTDPNADVGS